ncbi:AAEL011120-PA [Aedes aegypti]|uniref:AAEL011120-PA n=1 Tax=Aedes aegypti TaxID=7159 RepID=Q16QY5_AEDAE|nr:AAEL011120-PA [Aedes aegypti]
MNGLCESLYCLLWISKHPGLILECLQACFLSKKCSLRHPGFIIWSFPAIMLHHLNICLMQ